MGKKTEEIPVYAIGDLDANNKTFWLGSLERILENHSFLERPHKQSFYSLLFVEKADGKIVLDNHVLRLDESKVICIKPNSVCSIDINRSASGILICFSESFFSLRYNNNVLYQFSFLKKDSDYFVRLNQHQTEWWITLIRLMSEEMGHVQKGRDKVLRSYLNILLFALDRKFNRHATLEKFNSKEEKILHFEKMLEESFTHHKTPSFYAQQLHITTNYLNKLCHEYRGVTGGELIRKRIAIEAQRLLYYTTLSVSEVAHKLGFESPSYFITFFRKNTGFTPETFRKNNH